MISEDQQLEADLRAMDFEDLKATTDWFTLIVLNIMYTPDQVKKMDDAGEARAVAFETCHRYMVAMRVMAERFTELQSVKLALNDLL